MQYRTLVDLLTGGDVLVVGYEVMEKSLGSNADGKDQQETGCNEFLYGPWIFQLRAKLTAGCVKAE